MNILFTCAGRRTYLLNYFKEQLKSDGMIIGGDMQLTAPALSAADVALQLPAVNADDYVNTLLKICEHHSVDLLISLNDLELPVLSENKERFQELGVTVLVSTPEVIDTCFDKIKTARFIEALGMKTPKTYDDLDTAINAIENNELNFPLMLKPRWGSGSIGLEVVYSYEELNLAYRLLQTKIKRTILASASQGEHFIIIQQFIKGKEYGLDIMNDLSGNHIAVSVKQKLAMRAGETDKAITVDNALLREMGSLIGKKLKHIGNLDCDILEENGQYYVLELNPRFGGGFPFSYEAGVNLPGAIIAWTRGEEFEISQLQPRYDEVYAKCDIIVRR